MTVKTFNLPPNAEGVVAVVDSNTSAKFFWSSYEKVLYSDWTNLDFNSMNENPKIFQMLILMVIVIQPF
jgi:hypothetical protein